MTKRSNLGQVMNSAIQNGLSTQLGPDLKARLQSLSALLNDRNNAEIIAANELENVSDEAIRKAKELITASATNRTLR